MILLHNSSTEPS